MYNIVQTVLLPFVILLAIGVCDVLLQQLNGNSDAYDIYKNKEFILKNILPDLSVLKNINVGESKAEYFKVLISTWENQNIDRSLISKGKHEQT